jgi:glycine/D-amino acid oxidase-like deaminating enzyme
MRVLICGGGVIGACIAYFLARRGATAVVIERTGLACAASGKAGGFLALDWCDGSPLENLARRSFALHAQLADKLGGNWGYRRLTTYSGRAERRPGAKATSAAQLNWLSSDVFLDERLGSPATTAQVHPAEFTAAIMRAAQSRGAELRLGKVTGVLGAAQGRVTGVQVEDHTIEGDAVVIAMGPWSILPTLWLPLPAVYASKGHSIVYDTRNRLTADALFLTASEASGAEHSPEIYPRPDGTAWVCAISSVNPLPLDPVDVEPDPGAIYRLEALAAGLSPVLADSHIIARQACFRPVTEDGLPLIGPVPGIRGAYIATGHSVWGILNGPATGEAVAELIMDGGSRSQNLSSFDPARLPVFDPRGLRNRDQHARPEQWRLGI